MRSVSASGDAAGRAAIANPRQDMPKRLRNAYLDMILRIDQGYTCEVARADLNTQITLFEKSLEKEFSQTQLQPETFQQLSADGEASFSASP